jgi:uncharacterized membrane protein YhaH (DUF805 family)
MGFGTAVKTCFSKYVTFSGRARRPEYWWFFLFIVLGSVVANIADGVIFGFATAAGPATQVVSPVFSLATFLPLLAAGWRRMHDSGRPGWYLLMPLGVSVVMMLGLLLGVFGFAELEMAGADEEALRSAAGGFGLAGIAIAGAVQLVLTLLIIWWLTRPTQPGPNAYGDEP